MSTQNNITQVNELSEIDFNLIYQNTPVGIVILDTEGKIVRQNKRNQEIFGLEDINQTIGFCLFEDENIEKPLRHKLQEQDDFTYDYLLRPTSLHGYGECRISEDKYLFCRFRKIYNAQHEHIGFILVNTDVTQLHRKFENDTEMLNHRLQQIYYSSNMMTWDWNLKTGVINSNRAFAPHGFEHILSGIASFSREEFLKLIYPEDRHFFIDAVEKAMKGEISNTEFEIRFKFKDTKMPYVWVRFTGLISEYDESGNPSMMVGSTQIIQQRKQMEEDLRAAKEKAERSDSLKTAFIEQTNHEIRTPLNIITGYSDILSRSYGDLPEDEVKELVNGIRQSADVMVELVNNMLYLSQLQSGNLQRNDADFSVMDLLQHIYDKYKSYSTYDVAFILDVDDIKDVVTHNDNQLIRSILNNLLSNAFKFTTSGEVRLSCKQEADRLTFSVSDTGCGLPEDLDMAYGLFNKASQFTQGMGLGLPLCRKMLLLLGSELHSESIKGVGTTFSFQLKK